MIDLSNQSNVTLNATSGLTGSAPNYAGHSSYTSGAIYDNGEIGVKLSGTANARLLNLDIGNMLGNAIDYQATNGWRVASQLAGFHIHDSWCGIYTHNGGEALIVPHGHIDGCVFGAWIDSGNVQLGQVHISFCSIGIKISGGANDAHGTVTGAIVRHCYYLLSCSNVTRGENFDGCVFTTGQNADQGMIQVIESVGINFSGCKIAYANVSIDATSQVGMKGCVLRGPVNFTVASGGVLDAKANMVMPGSTVTLNGAAWTGNN